MLKARYKTKIFSIFILLFIALLSDPGNAVAEDWNQLAHDPQHTGYTATEPNGPWNFKWIWHSPDINGPVGAHAITGGNYVYMPTGSNGLYAINKGNGSGTKIFSGNVVDAPAYDPASGNLYVGTTTGTLYKLSTTGSQLGSYNTGSGINTAVLLVGDYVYVTTSAGDLHKVNKNTMSLVWVYRGGTAATTPPAYSNRGLLIFGDQNLYVHAVNDTNGSIKWKVKPTTLTGGCYSYQYGWPVVADSAGVIFMRTRLDDPNDWLWGPVDPGGRYPLTNSEIKAYLDSHVAAKNLFAIRLDNGNQAYTPAVGNGGVDDYPSCGGGSLISSIGPMPVVKTFPDGSQVSYEVFKNGDVAYYPGTTNPYDGRWDGHMGEMNLSNGDMRFIQFSAGSIVDGIIVDEFTPLTVAGNTIFYAHWGASEAYTITDRSSTYGDTRLNAIRAYRRPTVLRRIKDNGQLNSNHTTTGSLTMLCDERVFQSVNEPSFWVENSLTREPGNNDLDHLCSAYTQGTRPRYTFVADDTIYVVGNGGDIFAIAHSGSSTPVPTPQTTQSPLPTQPPQATNTPIPTNTQSPGIVGDANGDGRVDEIDYSIWLSHYDQNISGTSNGDFDGDGRIDGIDYVLWLINYS